MRDDSQSPETEEKLDIKRLLPIVFIIFVDLMGLSIVIPVLPYYALSYDAGPAVIGMLGASYPLMQLLGGPILSSLSDRFGRKPILAIAQFGTFCSLLMLGFANALWLIFAARLLDGLTGANLPTVQAAIADVTTPKTRNQGFGLVGAAFGLGFIFGPAISGIALSLTDNNYSAPAFVGACFAFLSVMLTTFVFKETLPPEKRGQGLNQRSLAFGQIGTALRNPTIGILLVIAFVQQLIFFAFQIMFAPYTLTRLGINSVGNTIFFAFIGVISVIVQGILLGRLTKRFGERQLIIGGLAALSLGLLTLSLTPEQGVPWYSRDTFVNELMANAGGELTPATMEQIELLPPDDNLGVVGLLTVLLSIVPTAFGVGVLNPSVSSLITKSVDPTKIGGILGVSAAFVGLANIAGPLWGGAAFDYIAPNAPFLIGAVVIALIVPVAIRRVIVPDSLEE